MPRERIEFFRISNIRPREKIIVLAFEGNITEYSYFSSIKTDLELNDDIVYLHLLARPKDDTRSAPIHVFRKLKNDIKDQFHLDLVDELWMIIDRDNWTNIEDINQLCKKEGNFYLAVSNPCFELWLLLHIKDISTFSEQVLKKIYENKKVGRKCNYIDRILKCALPEGYKKCDPQPKRFLPNIRTAILRAERLDINDEDYPTNIGTHVYKVVRKIIK